MSNLKKALIALLLLGIAAGAGFSVSASFDQGAVRQDLQNKGAGNEFDG